MKPECRKNIDSFIEDNLEFQIDEMYPRRDCVNYLWNDSYIATINQFGCGESWFIDENRYRHYVAKNDDIRLKYRDNRLLFIKDQETGEYWSPNRNFNKEPYEIFHTRVGLGYSTIVSRYRGIRCEFTVFVPDRHNIECWNVKIVNEADKAKRLWLTAFTEWALPEDMALASTHGFYCEQLQGVFADYSMFDGKSEFSHFFFGSDKQVDAYETDLNNFKGLYNLLNEPQSVVDGKLQSRNTEFSADMIAALQHELQLEAGEERTFRYVQGKSKCEEAAHQMRVELCNERFFEKALTDLEEKHARIIETTQITCPDESLNAIINVWIKRQIELGRIWGRVYGKGFRDIIQDSTAVVSFDAEAAAQKIRDCLIYQFEDGNTIRQWDPIDEHPYRDGAAWIAPAVNQYLKETGNLDFLNEVLPYFRSDKSGTTLHHLQTGVDFLLNETGENGLCLWGGGDWNDSINNAGRQMKGESVWLSQATVLASKELAEILEQMGEREAAESYLSRSDQMRSKIIDQGWDRDHFIYGINDWGGKIGSWDSAEAPLYLNTQSWAVLAGILPETKLHPLMDLVEQELKCDFGYMQINKSYYRGDDHVGRISYLRPGCYENGSVYNHGVAFKIAADCKLGRGNLAYETLLKMLPNNPKNPASASGSEPFAITNMYLGPDCKNRPGVSIMPWITGTAGWVYRCVVEYICGIQPSYSGFYVNPCIPSSWKEYSVIREFRGCRYKIHIRNPEGLETGDVKLEVDGVPTATNHVAAFDDGNEHVVIATLSSK